MNGRELHRVIKLHLLPHFPGFKATGNGEMIAVPLNHVCRKFGFASKSYATDSFYVYVSIVPLYVPGTASSYSAISRGLRGGQMWQWNESTALKVVEDVIVLMKTEGMELLKQTDGPLALATNGPRIFSTVPWPFLEAYAYSFIYAEKYAEAIPLIDDLCARIQSVPDLDERSQQWLERSQHIQTLLRTAPHEAKSLLAQWEKQTISNLRLDKYAGASWLDSRDSLTPPN